ncbi:unnamed protein product [Brachionus calyciflorus]|uniref:Endonuclease/exonuclease/phosphatase domain-containing protein n=1 Tax=Brachionus calyciflorus TaxID=104777 RepID=A0A814J9C6_9BILA|nr:unnamed protein product [Brachionus calyciflorus]
MQLRDYLDRFEIDICLLQETHFNAKTSVDLLAENLKNYQVYCPLSETMSRVVGFFIRNFLVGDQVLNLRFYENKKRIVSLDLYNRKISFVNIYSPNFKDEQVLFIENLYQYLYKKKNLILAGDFNNHFSLNVDTDKGVDKIWGELIRIFDLSEPVIKTADSDRFKYTWSNGSQFSRIDRFYFKSKDDLKQEYIESISTSLSDHKMIISDLSFENRKKPKSRFKRSNDWKSNELVLENEIVDYEIKKRCSFILMLIQQHGNEWYEFFINDVIRFLKSESRRVNSLRKIYIYNLFDIKNVIDKNNESLRSEIKAKIENYYEEERPRIEKMACEANRNLIINKAKS